MTLGALLKREQPGNTNQQSLYTTLHQLRITNKKMDNIPGWTDVSRPYTRLRNICLFRSCTASAAVSTQAFSSDLLPVLISQSLESLHKDVFTPPVMQVQCKSYHMVLQNPLNAMLSFSAFSTQCSKAPVFLWLFCLGKNSFPSMCGIPLN